jgi:glycopeptide antibiotics resistance protein
MTQIIKYILNMIPYMLCSLPLIIIFRIIRIYKMKKVKIKTNKWHEAGVLVFIVFLVGLASQTIIPKIEFGYGGLGIVGARQGEINLIPFKVFTDTYREVFENGYINYFIINFLGNIVMFTPFGFFVPLLWNKISFKKIIIIALSSSLFIEICQLPQSRGTDIDDLWINTLGACLGFLVFLVINKWIPDLDKKFKAIQTQ